MKLLSIIRNDAGLYEGNLIHYYKAVMHYATNLNNPYHNFRHMFHVLYMCYDACEFYKTELSPRRMRNLLIGALFHDFDHEGKGGPDFLQIMRAVTGLGTHIAPEDRVFYGAIVRHVEATQWPYIVPTGALSLPLQILRDADVSQAMSEAWLQQVVFGLAEEWSLTADQMLAKQREFLGALEFSTEWARTKFGSVKEERIAEATELLALLNS